MTEQEQVEPDAWEEMRETDNNEWQHFNYSDEKPDPHPYDMQKVEPLFYAETFEDKIHLLVQTVEYSEHESYKNKEAKVISKLLEVFQQQ